MGNKAPQPTNVLVTRLRRVSKWLDQIASIDGLTVQAVGQRRARANTCWQAAARLEELEAVAVAGRPAPPLADAELSLAEGRRLDQAVLSEALEALAFYADPHTYFAIAFLPDPPVGDFMEDFSDTDLGSKPGYRARAAMDRLEQLLKTLEGAGAAPLAEGAPRDYAALYFELLCQVAKIYDGESRHETALRYLRHAEQSNDIGAARALPAPPQETKHV